jgi:hypothetical protein
LLRRSFLQSFGPESSAILQLSPLVRHFPVGAHRDGLAPDGEWHSAMSCVQAAAQSRALVVWIGGMEPLFHPAIGEVTSALTDRGYYVFLHTSGAGFRKRIHEFKPVDRLFLTLEVPLNSATPQSEPKSAPAESFSTVSEALRVARLSGFHLCSHFTVSEAIDTSELASRIALSEPHRHDGIVVSSGSSPITTTVGEATRLIPSSGWRHFSHLLQSSYQQAAELANPQLVSGTPTEPSEACEESA